MTPSALYKLKKMKMKYATRKETAGKVEVAPVTEQPNNYYPMNTAGDVDTGVGNTITINVTSGNTVTASTPIVSTPIVIAPTSNFYVDTNTAWGGPRAVVSKYEPYPWNDEALVLKNKAVKQLLTAARTYSQKVDWVVGPTNYLQYDKDDVWDIQIIQALNVFTTNTHIYTYTTFPVATAPLNHRGESVRSFSRDNQFSNISPPEMIALQLLRKMISQEAFRRYLKHGFVMVQGPSGLVYQVDRRNNIAVWDRGEKLATLCVHLRLPKNVGGHCPPTDEVVGKMLIIECDEPDIWKRANIFWITNQRARHPLELIGQAA